MSVWLADETVQIHDLKVKKKICELKKNDLGFVDADDSQVIIGTTANNTKKLISYDLATGTTQEVIIS